MNQRLSAADADVVARMVELIDAGFTEAVSLRALASAIGREEASLGRLFRERMGMSVRRFIARRRIDRAVESIRQGVKVEAVALEVGYRSKKNFYRQFRRQFGMTPGMYRRVGSVSRLGSCKPNDETTSPVRVALGANAKEVSR